MTKYRTLIEMAKRARRWAYCPYSRYPVGAAVLGESGRIFTGANVENASYGLSICAERAAIFNAVNRGEKSIKAICVACRAARPCGACRQVMLEFSSKDTLLICVDVDSDGRSIHIDRSKVFSMLPSPFDPLDSGLLTESPQGQLKRRKGRSSRRRPRPKGKAGRRRPS